MVTSWKKAAWLMVVMGMLGGWAKAVEPDAVVPLWPGDGLPPGVKVQDPLDRLNCRPEFVMLMCPWNTWKVDRYPLKAPLPPVFLACADDDKVSIDFSDPLAERLKELQTPVLYWRVHGGGHSAFHRPSAWGKWMEKLVPWLKQQGFAVRPAPS